MYKAFCFDVFGTVFDWRNGIAQQAEAWLKRHGVTDIDPHEFADSWRARYQPAMQACREGRRPYVRLDVLHRENLDATLRQYHIDVSAISESELNEFNRAWHRLDPWPDVVEGLQRLKHKAIIATASNGNIAIMVNLARHAGICWDAILGAEVTGAYKPEPEAYTRMADILSLAPEQICMVAAHNYDMRAARENGLGTAFVPRPTEHGSGQTTDLAPDSDWNIIATDFVDLAAQAGG